MVERIFTKDTGRYKSGDSKDYPQSTWNAIATSAGFKLNEFTRSIRQVFSDSQKGQVKK